MPPNAAAYLHHHFECALCVRRMEYNGSVLHTPGPKKETKEQTSCPWRSVATVLLLFLSVLNSLGVNLNRYVVVVYPTPRQQPNNPFPLNVMNQSSKETIKPPKETKSNQTASERFWSSADELQCVKSLEISYSKLFQEVKRRRSHCDLTKIRRVNCPCKPPLKPLPNRHDTNTSWDTAFQRNMEMARNASARDVDLVFLGDSIVENLLGTLLGRSTRRLESRAAVFKELFVRETGGKVDALPLGISTDRSNGLLYRLQNGELPEALQPRVFWVLIGTNDLGDVCARESILMGVLRVIQEVWLRKPNATIVINSILPRGKEPLYSDSNKYWESIQWVNERLECFSQGLASLGYFNATRYFLSSNHKDAAIDRELMNDYLHPSASGYRRWGGAVLDEYHALRTMT